MVLDAEAAALDAEAAALYNRLKSATSLPASLRRPVRNALGILEAGLRLYGAEALLVSFNGGKDATVVLHLARAVFAGKAAGRPRCVYWDEAECFPEVSAFVAEAVAASSLQLRTYSCSFGDGLRDCVEQDGVRAVVLGTREGDPNARGAESFEPSSAGWPVFMRINPLLSWTFRGAATNM